MGNPINILLSFLIDILEQNTLITTIQNVAIVLVTIFIAIAIFLMDKDTSNFELDRKVLMNKVINAKSFMFYLMSIFAPFLLWDVYPPLSKFLGVIIFVIGIVKLLKFLHGTYRWIDVFEPSDGHTSSNYRMKLRLSYLDDVTNPEERGYEWDYIWDKAKRASITENRAYIERFLSNNKLLIESEDYSHFGQYTSSLSNKIGNLPLYDWVIYEKVLKETLVWDKEIFDKETTDTFEGEMALHDLLVELVNNIGKNRTPFMFFETLEKHLNIHIDSPKYIEELLEIVAKPLFELKEGDLLSILDDYFPEQWKFTIDNLKNNVITRIWFYGNYLPWTQRKIWDNRDSKDFDNNLDIVTYELLPNIDPPTWATWLTFLLQPYASDRKVDTLLKSNKCFGVASRPLMTNGPHSSEELEDMLTVDIQQKKRDTYSLLLYIFPKKLTVENLVKYKEEAESLTYPEHSMELLRRGSFIKQIDEILRLLRREEG